MYQVLLIFHRNRQEEVLIMTEKQYKRANTAVFPILLALLLLNVFLLSALIVMGQGSTNTYIQIIVYFIVAVIIVAAYITNRQKRIIK